MQHVPHHRAQNQERLSRGDLDRLVRGLDAGPQALHRILRDLLVDDPDLENSVHDAPNLRDCGPRVLFLVVQGIKPLLDFKRLYVLRDLVAPLGNQEVADVMVKDGLRVLRLWAGGYLRIELDLEVILRKLVEPDPLGPWVGAVDLYPKPEAVNLDIRFILGGEITDQTNN